MTRYDDVPVHDWFELDEAELRGWAAQYIGFCTNEMSDPDDLSWKLDDFDLSRLHSLPTEWDAYFEDEVGNNPNYDDEFARTSYHTPIVVSLEDGEIIIWDGWHRLACAIRRGDSTIMAIVGSRPMQNAG